MSSNIYSKDLLKELLDEEELKILELVLNENLDNEKKLKILCGGDKNNV